MNASTVFTLLHFCNYFYLEFYPVTKQGKKTEVQDFLEGLLGTRHCSLQVCLGDCEVSPQQAQDQQWP